ncbi:hypothetical protein ACER0C_003029 [Sarotherodon galilaeus]
MAKRGPGYIALTHGPDGDLATFELFTKGKGCNKGKGCIWKYIVGPDETCTEYVLSYGSGSTDRIVFPDPDGKCVEYVLSSGIEPPDRFVFPNMELLMRYCRKQATERSVDKDHYDMIRGLEKADRDAWSRDQGICHMMGDLQVTSDRNAASYDGGLRPVKPTSPPLVNRKNKPSLDRVERDTHGDRAVVRKSLKPPSRTRELEEGYPQPAPRHTPGERGVSRAAEWTGSKEYEWLAAYRD